jgi:ABC-type polysaccharide/polyol phosphate transport system ATPase subunit
MAEVLVKAEGVSKKFCRSLKRSLWYGVQDICADLNPFRGNGSPAKVRSLLDREASHFPNTNGTTESRSVFNTSMTGDGRNGLRRDEFWAVNDVSFELKRGECLGLIGRNGAGKTTLLKMLNGLIKPDHGRIEMRGRVGALIALGAGFNPILTGRENIYVNGAVLGLTKREIDEKIDEMIDFAEIQEFIDAPVQSYSSGMQVRLGFAVATALNPDVLLLDEVLAVGDISFQAKCLNTLSKFRKKGTAFILVSHNLHHIARYADQLLVLDRGRIHHLGDVETGIDHFIHGLKAPDYEVEGQTTDWSKVYGSGKVILTNARFQSSDGAIIEQVGPGEPFNLAIDFECPGEDVDDGVLDLLIRDKEGVLFQGTSLNYGMNFGFLPRQGRLIVEFESIPANARELQFFFAFLSRRTAEIYDWKRYIRLKMTNKPQLTGRLALKAQWKVESRAQSPVEVAAS